MFTISTSIICLWVRFQYNFLKCCTLAFLIKFNDMVVLINEIQIDGIAENYFISGSSIGIVHTQGTKLNQEVTQGDHETLLIC